MLELLICLLCSVIALQHLGFLVLEMFFWEKPLGLKIFRQRLEQARSSRSLAMNQGLYNGFLAAGLLWGIVHHQPHFATQILLFFLACIVVAGVFGAFTVSKKIFYVQALPAAVAIVMILSSNLT